MRKYYIPILMCGILILFNISIKAQNDTLVFINGDKIIGELKSMEKGIAVFKTDYSDSDFKVEWTGIKKVYTESIYLISVAKGTSFIGKLQSQSPERIYIIENDGDIVPWDKNQIVYLTSIDKGFWDRLSASIDIGFSLTKANNQRQLNTRSGLGYKADVWTTDAVFNTIVTTRDDADDTKRTEGSLNYRYILPRNWYSIITVSLLSNTEQKLDLRTNTQLGIGRFLLRTNSAFWGFNIGANRNFEDYSNETENRDSWECYLNTEVDLFDMGDFSLTMAVTVYKGLTEGSRWRADAGFDFKYDLPYDLYIKFGASYNYDNRPAEGAGQYDYVLQNGIGWEW